MNRPEAVRQFLTGIAKGYEVRRRSDDDFHRLYPGGFTPVLVDGNADQYVEIDNERVAALAAGYSDGQFDRLCLSIAAWQGHSAMDFAMQLEPDTIVLNFIGHFPEHLVPLAVAARRAGLPIVRYLGADAARS